MSELNSKMTTEKWPKLICLIGTDGTGKTTQANLLLNKAKAGNRRGLYRWFHYARFFSLPLLVYARLRNYSRYEIINGQKFGWWEFKPSVLLCKLLPWLMLIDAFWFSLFKIYIPLLCGYSIIADRYIWDIMVDIMQGIDRDDMSLHLIGKMFLKLVPGNTVVFLLDADIESLPQRRNDIKNDERLQKRMLCYRKLAIDNGIPVINANNTINDIHQEILDIIIQRRDVR